MSAWAEILKAGATTASKEGMKIAATRALDKPVDALIDLVGDVAVAVGGDRSPGALGRGRQRPITAAERALEWDDQGRVTKSVPSKVKTTIDEGTSYGAPGIAGEKVYDDYLTATRRVHQGTSETEKKLRPPTSIEEAQQRYFTSKGNIRSTYGEALGFSKEDATKQAVQGVPLPGLRGQPTIREDDFSLEAHGQKTSKNPFIDFAYKHPEAIGHGITYGAPLAAVAGVGLATYFATKPKSDYRVGFGNSGNANIDAAQASAYYQQQTAQMKFEHQMQLQQARQQAQTPGRQDYGKALGLGLPDLMSGGGDPRDAYNTAASIINATSPIYK